MCMHVMVAYWIWWRNWWIFCHDGGRQHWWTGLLWCTAIFSRRWVRIAQLTDINVASSCWQLSWQVVLFNPKSAWVFAWHDSFHSVILFIIPSDNDVSMSIMNMQYIIRVCQRFESCWITTNTMSSCQQCWWWRVKILKYLKIILFDVNNRCMNEVATLHKHIKWRTRWTSCEQSTVNHNSWELYVNLGIQMAQQLM